MEEKESSKLKGSKIGLFQALFFQIWGFSSQPSNLSNVEFQAPKID